MTVLFCAETILCSVTKQVDRTLLVLCYGFRADRHEFFWGVNQFDSEPKAKHF
jgi:hypothetical protein